MDEPPVPQLLTTLSAPAADGTKRKAMEIGAPVQYAQSSRKGKKAWRKNIDLNDIEVGLESMREEERVTGGMLQHRTDNELFTVDVTGDEQVRERVQRVKKPLRSLQILRQRSAVPAVKLPKRGSNSKGSRLTKSEKGKISKKAQWIRGATGESGDLVIEAPAIVKYDLWATAKSGEEKLEGNIPTDEARDYVIPVVIPKALKMPGSILPSRYIQAKAVEMPHPGASYNPTPDAHQSLLQSAHNIELARLATEEKARAQNEKARAMHGLRAEKEDGVTVFRGMKIDVPGEGNTEQEEEAVERSDAPVQKVTKRKTKAQRIKQSRALSRRLLVAEETRRKQLEKGFRELSGVAQAADKAVAAHRKEVIEWMRTKRLERPKPLIGKMVGGHKVKAPEVDVKLTEEIPENLRTLEPEGNLFRDRILSLQARSLLEPTGRASLRTRVKHPKLKLFEKRAWRDFK
ncbi:ribosome biogenesis protein Nop53/GLTSCR2 [Cantharellus anzutake]|uniref:ribosome biogenesis protein Nop53/GLTSCR2 n=1 Tax=Cantharellus anzutake TaxID=1750568 RepID=UPI001902D763|nr:ribosome biogenesis protein Nop53/GLTSCR2 [Cantharellus anzutake]KAF8336998.1 ribosome biogenesis protein Nop53/GLTSCR2 [Cantharellus anzutake]